MVFIGDIENESYLKSVLTKYEPLNASQLVYRDFLGIVETWAGGRYPRGYLLEMILSGSSAKGTAIHGVSDIDFLISLHNSIHNSRLSTLADVYESLYEEFKRHQFENIRKQKVSIGISFRGFDLDLVPAIKDLGNTNYHKLYINRSDKKYIQTNIKKNIDYVINSGACLPY
jgi:tRNA nucleotidyltransferase (CCA-adding enzyme)